MKRIRRLLLAIVVPGVLIGAMVSGALSAPALADANATQFQITASNPQFGSPTCLNDSCSLVQVTVIGTARSNLSVGAGTFQTTLVIDFSPGGTCNIVDENNAFAFDNGTIFIHSHHEDCATNGLRIDTTFQITGGIGAFAGASGSGREFSAVSAGANPLTYIGTISF
jgi:hypothetical protein